MQEDDTDLKNITKEAYTLLTHWKLIVRDQSILDPPYVSKL